MPHGLASALLSVVTTGVKPLGAAAGAALPAPSLLQPLPSTAAPPTEAHSAARRAIASRRFGPFGWVVVSDMIDPPDNGLPPVEQAPRDASQRRATPLTAAEVLRPQGPAATG